MSRPPNHLERRAERQAERRQARNARYVGIALLTLATIGTVKLLFDMDRLGMYPWQQSQTATIEAPPGCDAIVYSAPPPPGSPTCKPVEVVK
jgi:hypothetical protein